ncbi:FG-GAP repeat domain-containing protein [Streptomyces wedmorensis]|uniref:FG-GAP repeat domain-containing protein n=1 Tax=Streptomyces wedmorensis TaxID=43759 RepID=A0ABW6J0V8_STRWE
MSRKAITFACSCRTADATLPRLSVPLSTYLHVGSGRNSPPTSAVTRGAHLLIPVGGDPAETCTGAVDTRVDDIAPWIAETDFCVRDDFNGDGIGDIAGIWGDGSAHIYAGDKVAGLSGTQCTQPGTTTWKTTKHLAKGDFTNDGNADIMTVWTDGTLNFYKGLGNGQLTGFKRVTPAPTPGAPSSSPPEPLLHGPDARRAGPGNGPGFVADSSSPPGGPEAYRVSTRGSSPSGHGHMGSRDQEDQSCLLGGYLPCTSSLAGFCGSPRGAILWGDRPLAA